MEKKMLDLEKDNFTKADIIEMLNLYEKSDIDLLYKKAYDIKIKNVGAFVYFRGIIELSNICEKDCYYCGIRKSNTKVKRFIYDKNTILESAKWCYEQNYGSIVLQSGECKTENYENYITDLIKEIKKISNQTLGITLSLGEQTEETYKKWYDAGAHRYLLRIETSNKKLYEKIHPADHSFDERIECLARLKRIGYQVGTGVMIGIPEQKIEDLANDILFFKEKDIDMIGMGPYVRHGDTPLGKNANNSKEEKTEDLN